MYVLKMFRGLLDVGGRVELSRDGKKKLEGSRGEER